MPASDLTETCFCPNGIYPIPNIVPTTHLITDD